MPDYKDLSLEEASELATRWAKALDRATPPLTDGESLSSAMFWHDGAWHPIPDRNND